MKEIGITWAAKQRGSGNTVAERAGCECPGPKNKELVSNLLKRGWDQEGCKRQKRMNLSQHFKQTGGTKSVGVRKVWVKRIRVKLMSLQAKAMSRSGVEPPNQ